MRTPTKIFSVIGLALATLATIPAASVTSAPQTDDLSASGLIRSDGEVVIDTIDGSPAVDEDDVLSLIDDMRDRANVPDGPLAPGALPPGTAGLNGGLRAQFRTSVPSGVRTVIETAIAQWDAALVTPTPITIDVYWECFNNPGILGAAGPTDIYQQSFGNSYIFPAAIAHTLQGSDLNGSTSEIEMLLNAELSLNNSCAFESDDWYISTNASPGSGQIDLYSVVLHEVGHGLGFLGSAQDPDGAGPIPPRVGFPRFFYDSLIYAGTTPLLDTTNPNSHLTQNNLFFDIGGGTLHNVYAPSPFRNGSSFSHFDFVFQGSDPGVLMTPALGPGETRRALDAPVLGVLAQQGWDLVPRAVRPIIGAAASSGQINVTWDPNLGAYGTPPLSYEVRAILGTTVIATKRVSGSARSAVLNKLDNGKTYTLQVIPIDKQGWAPSTDQSVTLPSIPNKSQFVQSTNTGLNRLVSWLAPVAVSGGSLTYTVQSRPIYGTSWTSLGTTAATSVTTGNLSEGVYQFRIRASNSNGSGDYSYSTMIGASPTVVRPMPLDGQVGRLYTAYFLRQPELAGYEYWLGLRASGTPISEISAAFESSPEFVALYGSLNNGQFIDQVYQNVQGRPADASGKTFWLDYLANGNSRGSMIIGFSESAEYITSTGTTPPTAQGEGQIYRLYLAFFLREPDAAGLSFWVGQLNNGASLRSIADGFTQSPEFEEEYGSLTDDRFVELVYANVLTRPPDAAGLSFWVNELGNGNTTKGEMMIGFSDSLEFILKTGSLPS